MEGSSSEVMLKSLQPGAKLHVGHSHAARGDPVSQSDLPRSPMPLMSYLPSGLSSRVLISPRPLVPAEQDGSSVLSPSLMLEGRIPVYMEFREHAEKPVRVSYGEMTAVEWQAVLDVVPQSPVSWLRIGGISCARSRGIRTC